MLFMAPSNPNAPFLGIPLALSCLRILPSRCSSSNEFILTTNINDVVRNAVTGSYPAFPLATALTILGQPNVM